MEILFLIVGLFMIGSGFLVKSNPNLIAGYNTMSKEEKKNVDIEGLSTYICNGLITIGLTVILGHYFFIWIGLVMIANLTSLFVTLVGVTIMIINSQQYYHNKKKHTRLTYYILGIVAVFSLGLIVYGFIPSKAYISDNTILFSGMYGVEIKLTDIENIELSKKIPAIKLRTNGLSFGHIQKGTFELEKYGKCKLLLHSDKPPYLIISKYEGHKTIINFKDKVVTQDLYNLLVPLIDNK